MINDSPYLVRQIFLLYDEFILLSHGARYTQTDIYMEKLYGSNHPSH
jgi:hypothetical protein